MSSQYTGSSSGGGWESKEYSGPLNDGGWSKKESPEKPWSTQPKADDGSWKNSWTDTKSPKVDPPNGRWTDSSASKGDWGSKATAGDSWKTGWTDTPHSSKPDLPDGGWTDSSAPKGGWESKPTTADSWKNGGWTDTSSSKDDWGKKDWSASGGGKDGWKKDGWSSGGNGWSDSKSKWGSSDKGKDWGSSYGSKDSWSKGSWSDGGNKSWSKDSSGWGSGGSRGYGGGSGGGWGSGGGGGGWGQPLQLHPIDFSSIALVDFVKDFYVPTESVKRRSDEECEDIRRASHIAIVSGDEVPKVIVSFDESSFPEYIIRSLYRQFGPDAKPTPIQMQGWPIAMSGRSMVGIAQTGSGKTLAYILPAIVHINAQAPAAPREGPIALVLVPTRELCTQIAQETEKFTQCILDVGGIPTKIACAFGGVKKNEQVWALRDSLDILVAAPGRLMDFLNCGETALKRTTYLVLDEADQMFDMGFEPQLRQILGQIRPDRQTLMWSATWPMEVRNLARSICVDKPVHVQIGVDELVANHQIEQVVTLVTGEKEKVDRLFSDVLPQLYLADNGDRIEDAKLLIFCNKKDTVDYLTKRMRDEGVAAVAIHSGKEQSERLWVFDQFRTGHTKVLVSTNLMGRGVDVPKVNIVLNYDMPKNISEYIHRIGRTGRAGAHGKAITFMSYGDSGIANDLIRVMNEASQDVPDWLKELQGNPYYRSY